MALLLSSKYSAIPRTLVVGCNMDVTMKLLLFMLLLPTMEAYETIFMGHATIKEGYSYVCHQKIVSHTQGGMIDSRKEYYESPLQDCTILLQSPPGTVIDFRFTDISIIASNLNTCQDANLNIYDGTTNATSLLLAFPNGICGLGIPSFPIRSTSNTMLLKLRVTSPYTSWFSAVYTAFSTRTSVLCFYCGDLCLQSSQLCDGLENCWNGEDEEQDCMRPPPEKPTDNQDVEDLKLLLILILGSILVITLVIIIAVLVAKKVRPSCLEKQRRRRAAAAAANLMMMHPPLTPHVLAQCTASGNSTECTPVGLGLNRPFMAGPTVGTPGRMAHRAPRSEMPPPYTETVMEAGTELGGIQTTDPILTASGENNYSENPALSLDNEHLPHISDDEDAERESSANPNTIVNYTSSSSSAVQNGGATQEPRDFETSFVEGNQTSREEAPIDNIATAVSDVQLDVNGHSKNMDITVDEPENEIDNSAVNVSSRDTIYVIETLNIEPLNPNDEDNEEVVYI